MATEEQTSARKGRCANHPAVARVGVCDMCGRPLCVTCAVPVRGRVIGPECLAKVLVDVPEPVHIPKPLPARGDLIAALGFGVVMLTSIFPWSRFGASSHYFGAWSRHWSVVAVLAAVLGLALIVVARRRPVDSRIEPAALSGLAIVAALAAFLHHRKPPLLSAPTGWPWIAILGAAVALLGTLVKIRARVRARRPMSTGSLPS